VTFGAVGWYTPRRVSYSFPPAPRKPLRRTMMGVRVEVREGEQIGQAVRRLKKSIRYQLGWKTALLRPDHFVPQSEVRRKKAWKKLVASWQQKRHYHP
jgi:ribosomal protein S21